MRGIGRLVNNIIRFQWLNCALIIKPPLNLKIIGCSFDGMHTGSQETVAVAAAVDAAVHLWAFYFPRQHKGEQLPLEMSGFIMNSDEFL